MNTNKKGFTLIELLVVIVIIGILATISVATFGGYFKKARDAERQSAVQNIATIMKVLNATEETVDYSVAGRAALDTKLNTQGYATPDSKNGYQYTYLYSNDKQDFVVAGCSEENADSANSSEQYFAAGTPNGVAVVTGCGAADGSGNRKVTLNASGGDFVYASSNEISW